ncbi:hypothetical protein ACFL1S_08835 [Pseudomonadota bacterium]
MGSPKFKYFSVLGVLLLMLFFSVRYLLREPDDPYRPVVDLNERQPAPVALESSQIDSNPFTTSDPLSTGDGLCDSSGLVVVTIDQQITGDLRCDSRVRVIFEDDAEVTSTGHLQVVTPQAEFNPGFRVNPGGQMSVYSD